MAFTPGIDLQLDDSGDLVIDSDLHFTTGLNSVAQGIRVRLQMFKGEWFADLDTGVPWYQDILGQKFSQTKIRDAVRTAILASPEVDSLDRLDVSYDSALRLATVSWEARSNFGVIIDEVTV